MSRLLHISSSPRGGASESLGIANAFLDGYRQTHPDTDVDTWDLWAPCRRSARLRPLPR